MFLIDFKLLVLSTFSFRMSYIFIIKLLESDLGIENNNNSQDFNHNNNMIDT